MIQLLKGILKNKLNVLQGRPHPGLGEFAQRIQHRNRTFWGNAAGRKLKHELISANDPMEAIRSGEYWQRRLSNKFNSREFVTKLGGRVPDLYWKGRDVSNINFRQLPRQFVIRPTLGHSCNLVFLMNDSVNLMDQRTYKHKELVAILKKAVAEHPHVEFLVEEFIRSEDGAYKIPKDYKFYTFNGEIARIEVINRLGPNEGTTSLYTPQWKEVESLSFQKYGSAPYEDPPRCLEEMIDQAKAISKAYEIFVRIDFYATDKGAVFGEFTPTPALGKVFTPKAEALFIRYWNQYCEDMI
jgi:hypothetical protein